MRALRGVIVLVLLVVSSPAMAVYCVSGYGVPYIMDFDNCFGNDLEITEQQHDDLLGGKITREGLIGGYSDRERAASEIDETYGAWRVRCSDDRIYDLRTCVIHSSTITVGIASKGIEMVTVGRNTYPGSEVVVRVDENPPIDLSEDISFETYSEVIEQLKAGDLVLTRHTEWPSQTLVNGRVSLIGFTKAHDRAKELVADYKP